MDGHSRRDLLIIAASAVAAVPAAGQEASAPALKFFTPAEFRVLDELAEIIIPSDSHSPGARAAKVAAYLDKSIGASFEDTPRQTFRDGLKTVDKLSHQLNGKPFMDATAAERVAVVERMARNEQKPSTPAEHFFGELKGAVAFAYYTSSIGIHQEMQYKGNTVQTEFSGFDADLAPLQPPDSSK